MPLTDTEKAKVKKYLGYPLIERQYADNYWDFKTSFVIDRILDNLPDEAVTVVQDYLAKLDSLETALADLADTTMVEGVGSVRLRDDAAKRIKSQMRHWVHAIADVLNVEVKPGSAYAGAGINVEVKS